MKRSAAELEREIAASLVKPRAARKAPARMSNTDRKKLGAALRRAVKSELADIGGYRRMRHDDYQRAGEAAISVAGLRGRAAAQASDDGVEIFEIVAGSPHVDYGALVRWYDDSW